VLIDITKDAQQASCEFEWEAAAPVVPGWREAAPFARSELARARMIKAAERPVILAGHGVTISGAEQALRAFAEQANIPIAATLWASEASRRRIR
jgi:acetolactate synthase-1/2/3 large subunit